MIILTLGPILFADFEIPETVSFGGNMVVVKHRLLGGNRILDVMGTDDSEIPWSGRFRGSDAETRAKYLDYLKAQGKPLPLQWSGLNYTVVISSFKARFHQTYEVEYEISCTVSRNNSNPILNALFSLDAALGDSLNQVGQIAAVLNVPGVTTAVGALQTATSSVQTFEGVGSDVTSGVLDAITGAQAIVGAQTVTADANTGFSLPAAGNAVSGMASALTGQADALAQAASLRDLSAQLGTMAKNIGSAIS